VKRFFVYTVAVVFVFEALSARNRNGSASSFDMWVGAGYSNIIHTGIENVKPLGGAGGIIGLGYGYQNGNFIMQTGVEFDYNGSSSKVKDFDIQVGEMIDANTGLSIEYGTRITADMSPVAQGGFYDTDGDQFIMLYKFKKYKDYYHIGYLNIPLLFGGKFGKFYFLAGGKFGVNIFAMAKTSAVHSSTAYYPQFIDVFGDMNGRFLVTEYKSGNNTYFNGKLNYSVSVSLEAGMTFGKMRIALFADYGLLNINRSYASTENTNGDFVYIPATNPVYAGSIDPNIIHHNSILTSNQSFSSKVYPLMAGIKLTVLLQKQKDRNYMRDCPAYGISYKKKHERSVRLMQKYRY
jgi:hypothetical protein